MHAYLPIPGILAEHRDALGFLIEQRPDVCRNPSLRLDGVARFDQRIDAHLDGLRHAGQVGIDLVGEQILAKPHPGDVACLVMLSPSTVTPAVRAAVTALVTADATHAAAAVAGCAFGDGMLPVWLHQGLTEPLRERLSLQCVAQSGIAERLTPQHLAAAQPPAVLAAAIDTVGRLGRVDLYAACRPHLTSDDIGVRFATAWTLALRTASGESRTTLQWFATARSPHAEAAALLAARRLDGAMAQAWIDQLAATHPRFAVQVAGTAGDPVRLPWLLERCADPALARVAGEAISLITGVDIAFLDLDGEPPAGFTPPDPTDDPADPNVDTDPDEHLPWPNAAKLSRWLSQQSFSAGVRYLCGKPIEAAWCQQVLRDGYQRQRLAAAYELAAIAPSAPMFNTAAPAWVQRKALG